MCAKTETKKTNKRAAELTLRIPASQVLTAMLMQKMPRAWRHRTRTWCDNSFARIISYIKCACRGCAALRCCQILRKRTVRLLLPKRRQRQRRMSNAEDATRWPRIARECEIYGFRIGTNHSRPLGAVRDCSVPTDTRRLTIECRHSGLSHLHI